VRVLWKDIKNTEAGDSSPCAIRNATKRTLKETGVSDDLLERVVEFHGHLGPFLVLGVKAGLHANSLLGKDCFKMTSIVATEPSPPTSCFVDGVQFVTGCTMGKRNIKLKKGKGTLVAFSKDGKTIKLKLKEDVRESINRIMSEEQSKRESLKLAERPVSELFEVEKSA
jgi:formylmethanofuran dehydrogenase subunit E